MTKTIVHAWANDEKVSLASSQNISEEFFETFKAVAEEVAPGAKEFTITLQEGEEGR